MRWLLCCALLASGCGDSITIITNGEDGNLYAEIKTASGVQLLGKLPAGATSRLYVSRHQRREGKDVGRMSERVSWTTATPRAELEPASVATVGEILHTGVFLELVLRPLSPGKSVLRVVGDLYADRWTLTFE